MRLDTLDLMAYGPFTGTRLDFESPFTIVYGSAVRRGLLALLSR
jgi:hypothetical protein